MSLTSNEKIARSIKRKSYMQPMTISDVTYQICYESGFFTARLFNKSDECEKIYIMSESTFVNDFINGKNIHTNTPVRTTKLREEMNIYVPNNTRAYML